MADVLRRLSAVCGNGQADWDAFKNHVEHHRQFCLGTFLALQRELDTRDERLEPGSRRAPRRARDPLSDPTAIRETGRFMCETNDCCRTAAALVTGRLLCAEHTLAELDDGRRHVELVKAEWLHPFRIEGGEQEATGP
ncbi:MAG TPA: hypothetical protein VK009_28570 [Chloroflexota bacterium]|nr:hypothetical protein [Chloroflexota bacterium]